MQNDARGISPDGLRTSIRAPLYIYIITYISEFVGKFYIII